MIILITYAKKRKKIYILMDDYLCVYTLMIYYLCVYVYIYMYIYIYIYIYIYSNGWLFMCIYSNGWLFLIIVIICLKSGKGLMIIYLFAWYLLELKNS